MVQKGRGADSDLCKNYSLVQQPSSSTFFGYFVTFLQFFLLKNFLSGNIQDLVSGFRKRFHVCLV